MSLVYEVTLKIREADLLSAIWYSDGSGVKVGSGLEGTAEEWQINEITLESYPEEGEGCYVRIVLERARDDEEKDLPL